MTLDEITKQVLQNKYDEQFNAFNTWLDSVIDKLWNKCTQAAQNGQFGTFIEIPKEISVSSLSNATISSLTVVKLKKYSSESFRVNINNYNNMLYVYWGYMSLSLG